jgi:hypothetical protein
MKKILKATTMLLLTSTLGGKQLYASYNTELEEGNQLHPHNNPIRQEESSHAWGSYFYNVAAQVRFSMRSENELQEGFPSLTCSFLQDKILAADSWEGLIGRTFEFSTPAYNDGNNSFLQICKIVALKTGENYEIIDQQDFQHALKDITNKEPITESSPHEFLEGFDSHKPLLKSTAFKVNGGKTELIYRLYNGRTQSMLALHVRRNKDKNFPPLVGENRPVSAQRINVNEDITNSTISVEVSLPSNQINLDNSEANLAALTPSSSEPTETTVAPTPLATAADLHNAAWSQNYGRVEELIRAVSPASPYLFPNSENVMTTPLHIAAINNDIKLLETLLAGHTKESLKARDTILYSFDTAGWTIFHTAAYNGSLEILRYLLSQGSAYGNHYGRYFITREARHAPIYFAAMRGHGECVKILDPDPLNKDPQGLRHNRLDALTIARQKQVEEGGQGNYTAIVEYLKQQSTSTV